MIKHIVIATKFCNFIVVKVKVEPISSSIDSNGKAQLYSIRSASHDLPPHTITVLPHTRKAEFVFDTVEEAEAHAESVFQLNKEIHIEKLQRQMAFQQKRLDKMMKHTPKIRRLYLEK